MYGVFCTTPPHTPAMTVARASVMRMSRARYSSPAAAALSVLSMPPMMVTRANGSATERYGAASGQASRPPEGGHARDGAEQRGARHPPPRRVSGQGETELEEADGDRREHPGLPRELGVSRGELHRPEHPEDHGEERRRVDAERHGGDVVASRLL